MFAQRHHNQFNKAAALTYNMCSLAFPDIIHSLVYHAHHSPSTEASTTVHSLLHHMLCLQYSGMLSQRLGRMKPALFDVCVCVCPHGLLWSCLTLWVAPAAAAVVKLGIFRLAAWRAYCMQFQSLQNNIP